MKRIFVPYCCAFFCSFCFACNQSETKTKEIDPFYSQNGVFDRLRIPLIKPYVLIKINDAEWSLELQTTRLLTLSIHHIQGVDTIAGKILIYSKGGTEVNNIQYDESWFIIEPTSLQERAFSSHKAFENAIADMKITSTDLREPDVFYNELYNKKSEK